ncbi:MAG: hypothetical protein WB808_14005 [Candidatus Dormiibacterota bacterium]
MATNVAVASPPLDRSPREKWTIWSGRLVGIIQGSLLVPPVKVTVIVEPRVTK